MKRTPQCIRWLSIAALVAALGAACNVPFPLPSLTALPPGPPSRVEPAAKEPAARKEPVNVSCAAPSCPAAARPAGAVARPVATKIALAERKETPAPASMGPRLTALIARDELEKLAAGRIVFNAPEQMRVGEKTNVEMRLTGELLEDFADRLDELGIEDADEIAAGSSLQAHLAGDGFEIGGSGDDEKVLDSEGFAPWSWQVTPVRSGDQPLALTVTVRIKIPGGGEEKKELPVFTKNVAVASDPAYSTLRFVRARWPWLIGGLLAILAIELFLRRRR